MMAIALCGVLACAVTGCKYDDEGVDGNTIAESTEIPTDGDDLNGGMTGGQDVPTDESATKNAGGADMSGIQGEDGVPATGVPFDQDPNYVRCTDVDFAPVYFGFDASNLQASEMAKIEAVAAHLKQTGRVVIVEGNCDEYLAELGVDVKSVQDKSYGEEKPAVVGHDESAWSKNRRGEFAVFAKKQ